MKVRSFVLAAALALGLGGAASASPLPDPAQVVAQPGVQVEFTKWKAKHGWKGHGRRHYGWRNPRRHYGWRNPRRHYGWYNPRRHYGWRHARPRGVYYRF